MNCPFCETELIDAFHDHLWKEARIDTENYFYCVRCELTFDRDNIDQSHSNDVRLECA